MLDGKAPPQELHEIISELKRYILDINSRPVKCPGLIYIDKAIKVSIFPFLKNLISTFNSHIHTSVNISNAFQGINPAALELISKSLSNEAEALGKHQSSFQIMLLE